MKRRRDIPWDDIRNEYVTTNTSYPKLAAKYGIDFRQIGAKGKNEGWVAQRRKFVEDKQKKIEEEAKERGLEALRRCGRIAELALDRAEELLGEPGGLNGTQLEAAVSALQKAASVVREVYGLMTPTEQARVDIDREKLALEREKAARNAPDENADRIIIGSEIYGI